MIPRILTIAGSDSSGGAGIQADIKTITMLGGYAMSAITSVTAQDTRGVHGTIHLPGEFVLEQVAACVEDIGVDAIKIGMLGNEDIVRHVAQALEACPGVPLVLDPVMIATSGGRLADTSTVAAMVEHLFARATLITPNIPELEVLAGASLETAGALREASAQLAARHGCHVLVKGGHSDEGTVVDILTAPDGSSLPFEASRIATRHTHGTGCTLAAGIATMLGRGLDLSEAVDRARAFVRSALRAAPGFGQGSGPLGHAQARGA